MIAYAYKYKRNLFYDNVVIGAFYDCPGGIWNGGRQLIPRTYDLQKIKNGFLDSNIPLRFTFTNPILQAKHLLDDYCNSIVETFNTGNNEILCNSPLLEQYLRKKYSNNYKYISSITKCLRTDFNIEDVEISKDKYYLTVLDFDWNNNFSLLSKIQNKDKCEILVNSSCIPKCRYRENHYQAIAELELYGKAITTYKCGSSSLRYYETKQYPHYISPQDIENIYLPMGFKHFKLEGRQMNDLELIEVVLDYLIKDEYKLEVRSNLQTVNHPIF